MGKQLDFGFHNDSGPRDGFEMPPRRQHAPSAYEQYPEGKDLEANDLVTLIHRCGATKRVRYTQVVGPRIYVIWPIANDDLAISTKTGRVVAPRSMAEWRLEPNALQMARVANSRFRLERKVAVEE